MKYTMLTLSAALLTLPAYAADAHEGSHRMPDGTWMKNHEMENSDGPSVPGAPSSTAATGKTVVANVNGLVCDFCAQSVRKTLMKEPGVADARVDLTAKTVTVSMAKGTTLERDRLAGLLKDAGYDLTAYKVE